MSNKNKVAWTRKTTTQIFAMDQIGGIRRSISTEIIETVEEIGLDPLEIRHEEEVRAFNSFANGVWDDVWYGRSR